MPRRAPLLVLSLTLFLTAPAVAAEESRPSRPALALPTADELEGASASSLPAPSPTAPVPGSFRTAAAALAARFDPADFDPDLRAAALGDGVEPALVFVRDQIRHEAYPGAFRGADGAYRARAANAADRSLLLARLLKQKGIEIRFAQGRLARQDAERLVARMFDPPAAANRAKKPAPRPDAADQPAAGADFVRRLRARAVRDYAAITRALQADAGAAPPAASPSRDELLEEATRHVWVQAKIGQQWVDLDASFADAAPGKAYCRAERTSATLPDEFHQRVTVRVLSERLVGGRLRTDRLLEVTRPAADWLDRHVFLLHAPLTRQGAARALGGGGAAAWTPLLWVDGEVATGKPVPFEATGAAPKPGGATGLFDSLPGGDAPAPAAPDGQFVREVLEFEIRFPDGRREAVRRVLCDRGGEAWRRAQPPEPAALKPLPRNARGPLAAQAVHSIWFGGVRPDLIAFADALDVLANVEKGAGGNHAAPPEPNPETSLSHRLWPMSLQHFCVALWGDACFIPALNTDPAVRFYPDSPRILLLSAAPAAAPEGAGEDEAALELSIDLRRDRVRGVARDPGGNAVARGKTWYGLLEGALEHELAAQQAVSLHAATPSEGAEAPKAADVPADVAASVRSTSAFLGGDGVVVLRPKARPPAEWESLAARREIAARAADALAAGETLVVPAQVLADASETAEPAWWALSPAGDVRAVWGADLHGGLMTSVRGRALRGRALQSQPWGNQRTWTVDENQVRHGSRGRPGQRPRTPPAGRPGAATNEYILLMEQVSARIAEATGYTVGDIVFTGVVVAEITVGSLLSAAMIGDL